MPPTRRLLRFAWRWGMGRWTRRSPATRLYLVMRCMVEVSAGELLDRISILQIKVQRLPPEQARVAARALTSAVEAKSPVLSSMSGLEELSARLLEVNLALWAAEDELRALQRRSEERRVGNGGRSACRK